VIELKPDAQISVIDGRFKGNTGKIIGIRSSIGSCADYLIELDDGRQMIINSKHMQEKV
jgi:hypothetical protein